MINILVVINQGVNYMGNLYKVILKIFNIKYGKKLKLSGIPVIIQSKNSKIKIGENVRINSSLFSNLIGLYQRTIIVTRTCNSEIIIGDNVGISGTTIYARKSIKIGDNTLIGANTKIIDNDFHPIEIRYRNENNKAKIRSKEIIIGKNCFIGCNTLILKGTNLGDGCVVGAGSVVCGEFPNDCVIAGNPAKIIRKVDNEK